MVKLKKIFSAAPLGRTQMMLFILIELLLLFGKEFSKFHVIGSFYLYDILFLLLAGGSAIAFFRKRQPLIVWPILLILSVSVLYLVYSWFSDAGPLNYIIRQYGMFVYLGGMYLIFFSFINKGFNEFNIRFIAVMGIGAFILQIGYHLYNFVITPSFSSGFFSDFNYYSLLQVMAMFVFEAYALVYIKKWWKWALIAVVLFLSLTMGHHSSVILATLAVLGGYFFMRTNTIVKIALSIGAVAGLFALYNFVPEYFQDHNSLWRLIYWKYALKDIILTNYGLIGHGFGVKYVNQEVMDALRTMIQSPWFEVRPEEQYVTPMHNSFITIGFHIGLVFVFLLIVPVQKAFAYFFNRKSKEISSKKDFMVLALLGVIVWTNFHVVLELPHSSSFFWLIYFSTVYLFNFEKKTEGIKE